MSAHAVTAYSKVRTQTGTEGADPHRLIQMLIDGAIEKVNRSKFFLKQNKLGEKGHHISWAISIIGGLKASLNHEAGGDLAGTLDSLYDYCTDTLVQANIENSEEKLNSVLNVMNEIKQGWDGIREQALAEIQR